MATNTQSLPSTFAGVGLSNLGSPLLVLLILLMMIIPLAPFALDMMFTFNITLSLIVLLAVIYSKRPLEFAAFPTVILIATLLRLSLNVASTRIVLLEGHTGTEAAGQVIHAFGDFVVGGNHVVGFVVFIILVIINFVVVTKGAGRISEVTARFTLDAMPGKQMAVDADLNSGVINQDEARQRRIEISQESDFYGSMDGASKFVRGDAAAGIMILLINIIGGLCIGSIQHGLPISQAAEIYVLLTIGDGLVAQIPSLLLSTSAAIMVTRVSSSEDMGEQIVGQLFNNTKGLAVTGGMLALMGLIPGMPNIAFLLLGGSCIGGAWWIDQRRNVVEVEEEQEVIPDQEAVKERELSWEDIEQVDAIGLEVGYRLIPLVDQQQGGELLNRVKGVRKKLSKELGFLLPSIHIRDNLDLEPNSYRITINDSTVGRADVQPGNELAINPGHVYGELPGNKSKDPVFGLESVWIDISQRDQAQSLGYTVVDSSTVVATHLSQLLQEHAHELIGHKEVKELLDRYEQQVPEVLQDTIPKLIPQGMVARVLQNLLQENIPVRDLKSIIETLIRNADKVQDPDVLTSQVRIALGRMIVERISGEDEELPVITLDGSVEHILQQSLQNSGAANFAIEPGMAQRLIKSLREACESQEAAGQATVLLVSDGLRGLLARFTRHNIPRLNVLCYSEIPESKPIRIVASVGGQAQAEQIQG